MKKYELKLVRPWLSIFVFLFVIFSLIALIVFQGYYSRQVLQFNPTYLILCEVGFAIFWLLRNYDRVLVSYDEKIVLGDSYFEIGAYSYDWSQVRWYRKDTNSPLMQGLVVKLQNGTRINLFVSSKNIEGLQLWEELSTEFIQHVKSTDLPIRNYYDTPIWRGLAWLSLLSNAAILIGIVAFDIDLYSILPGLLIWFGSSSAFAAMVFSNRRKKR